MPTTIRSSVHHAPADAITAPPEGPWSNRLPERTPWRGLYMMEPDARDIDALLSLRGTRWHAQTRFLAAFAQGMRRLF